MSQTRFPLFPLAILIIIGLLIMGGFSIHRISWMDGYKTGQLVARGADGAVMPYPPYQSGCGGPLLTLGVIFLLFLVVGKFFRFWAWKMARGPWMMAHGLKGERWARHWHRPHGPMPPWCWGWEEPSKEETEEAQAEPDVETDAAEV